MRRVVPVLLSLLVVAGVAVLLVRRQASEVPPGTLYGNVEIRQVDLSFNAEGGVIAMPKREGDRVRAGEVIAELDPATYQSATALAEARRDTAKANLDVLLAGTTAGGHRSGAREPRGGAGVVGRCRNDIRAPAGPGGAQRVLAAAT